MAIEMRMARTSMLEVLRQDYVRTALAKGLESNAVNYKHALRNAFIPLITVIGIQMGGLLGGSVIIEQIFGRPGWVGIFCRVFRGAIIPLFKLRRYFLQLCLQL